MQMFIYLIASLFVLTSCSTLDKLKFWEGDDKEESAATSEGEAGTAGEGEASAATASHDDSDAAAAHKDGDAEAPAKAKSNTGSKKSVKNMTMEELELKQAKLWARVDSLEEQNARQRERMRVIEKGLMLGLIPEELKDDAKGGKSKANSHTEAHAKPAVHSKEKPKTEKIAAASTAAATDKAAGEGSTGFEERMAAAQDFFRAGRYGRAIAEYSSIGKEFKQQDRNGSHQFWIALSWLNLKEMNTAQQNFENFLQEYPSSPWAVRAHFYLARVETQMGMRDKSLQRLRRIISEFPNEDVAEMAKMEISNMGKTL